MAFTMQAFLRDYDWNMDELEPGLWHGSFTTEREVELDLYALIDEEWLHMGVTPFAPRADEGIPLRLALALLRLNERLPLVRFTLDDGGDISLRVDLPVAQIQSAMVGTALDVLVAVADTWSGPIARMVANPNVSPPEFIGAGITL